jgi:phosphoribosylanthranilate isomerase
VKICCISSIDEAQLAVRLGASAIGLVSQMPSGPGVIPDELIAEIASTVPPRVATFLLTSKRDAKEIAEQHHFCGTSTIQLVDTLDSSELIRLRKMAPSAKIVQVIHVMDEGAIEMAKSVSSLVDMLLLDSGNPTLAVKELGGTGRVHNWEISRRIRDQVACPLFLAGGLGVSNVRAAIELVQPYGVDLCSSVRREDKLSGEKLSEFMLEVSKSH